ncbi:putative dibenzothiophene desulfurization enzyme A [Acephala macrosclerotiorum]|nr:putative dibenzothiophene desulfurization enzyme A [Acephala macrosclerotiorum]
MSSEPPPKRQKNGSEKKRIFINAFDMFTVGHLSFGQWRNPRDRSASKRRDLSYWTELAKLLEEGDINALFLADTFGQYDVYKGSAEPGIRTGAQYPMGDPAVPVTAMAAVTKNLGFAITTSTSYESPYIVAKRFSTLDHLTKGRFGWNIVTSWKESATRAVGLKYVEHDKRYEIADEFVRVLYKLWEGSWADDALKEDRANEIYSEYKSIRTINHHGKHFSVDAPHILDPSPQRTPFLFQAGTSPAGIAFGATHAEGIFVSAFSPHILAPRVKAIREKAAEVGRDPKSVKVFAIFTPIIGKTKEDAQAKYQEALKYASPEGGLAFFSGGSGIDLSKFNLDAEIKPSDSTVDAKVHSLVASLNYRGTDVPVWTPRNIGKLISIGGSGPVPVGTAEEVADVMEEWIGIADLDGFNIGYVLTPGSFEDLVHLLVPELRKRGRYAPKGESGTMRERIYGQGQSKLRDDHTGSKYKYDVYDEAAEENE